MECRDNQTMTAVTEVMRHQLQPYLFQDRDVVRAHVHSFGCQLNVSDGERIRGMLIGVTEHNKATTERQCV